jgi:hypothetical protein
MAALAGEIQAIWSVTPVTTVLTQPAPGFIFGPPPGQP